MPTLEIAAIALPASEVLVLIVIGLVAGSLGGLLGIGGGIVMIPAISLLLGRDIHLAQAASMNVIFFVAAPAAFRHWRAGGVKLEVVKRILPFAMIFVLLGVTASIWIPNADLSLIFGTFLIYVLYENLRRLVCDRRGLPESVQKPRVTWVRGGIVGSSAGFGAGLLGIGGGLITVPVTQLVCRCPLRECIACSSTVMCLTSVVGAVYKDATLTEVPGIGDDVHWYTPLGISVWLIPTCLIGSWFGARLTHVLPLNVVRLIFIAIVAISAAKMLF
ncbi:MAG: sulfite exporter TauE/SafE family protein [Planctomycetes bacterium]|nr:sulfite exporter TauE/SafE family protein [Planctomycetota bacterium]MCP4839789.1 sulfite exporter TauE/SafE family protein [Planctomycetota bacterium]